MSVLPTEAAAAGFEPAYTLGTRQLHNLSAELVAGSPVVPGRLACYRVPGTSPLSNLGRVVEREVFEGSFGNDADEMTDEYGPYEASSDFFVMLDTEEQMPVGALRVIEDSPAGLKTLDDIAGAPLHVSKEEVQAYHGIESLENAWDVGTVAVLPGYRDMRRHIVSSVLYRALYASALGQGIDHYVSVMDVRVHKTLTRVLGFPFEPICGTPSFSYLGSQDSVAVYGHVPDFRTHSEEHMRLLRQTNPIKGMVMSHMLLRMSVGRGTDKMVMFDY